MNLPGSATDVEHVPIEEGLSDNDDLTLEEKRKVYRAAGRLLAIRRRLGHDGHGDEDHILGASGAEEEERSEKTSYLNITGETQRSVVCHSYPQLCVTTRCCRAKIMSWKEQVLRLR